MTSLTLDTPVLRETRPSSISSDLAPGNSKFRQRPVLQKLNAGHPRVGLEWVSTSAHSWVSASLWRQDKPHEQKNPGSHRLGSLVLVRFGGALIGEDCPRDHSSPWVSSSVEYISPSLMHLRSAASFPSSPSTSGRCPSSASPSRSSSSPGSPSAQML